ncbi:DUF2637 domain-containing protein [Streptomyces broussonetiae]|uniref:DUF2637 domain-containing protein n=1 Tax=Streptomyces broussonetiae TaxID=2686304 RepID=A0A6I6MV62_9ACTN|nr:DUF2637 domain-containing protein [Streptomyces broussonetiae]QHA04598.1 DUF2637 domain-containing protein [Streptomyces broussonetiae]
MPNAELTVPSEEAAGQTPVRPRTDAQLGLAIGAAVLTTALTAVSFWLSYEGLHGLAAAHRLQGGRAWAWPATVDSFIGIGELLILRASLMGRVDPWAIVLTSAGSLGSIALNVAGVGVSHNPLDYIVAAVPPVAALLAFGVLMRQIHDFLVSHQSVLTAPPVPSALPVTAPVKADSAQASSEPGSAVHTPVEEPVMTPVTEPVIEPETSEEPLTQREQVDLVVRRLYDVLGNRRPATRHIRQALADRGLPNSDGTCREARKRVELAEPHLKDLPEAIAA